MTVDYTISDVFLALLFIAAALFVSWRSYLQSGYRSKILVTEALRVGLVIFAALMLFQPTYVIEAPPAEKSVVRVLIDQSESMATEDTEKEGVNVARSRVIEPLAESSNWQSRTSLHDYAIESFSGSVEVKETKGEATESANFQSGTDIQAVLDEVVAHPENVRGVVLASDGDWNLGDSPVSAARELKRLGIPVYTVGVGRSIDQPDVSIQNFDLPTFSVIGKPLRIPFSVKSNLQQVINVDAEISLPDGDIRYEALQIPAVGSADAVVSWRPSKTGTQQISIRIPQHPDERDATNNSQTLPIEVRHESLAVLMIDSYPRWEYRYTRNALMRDPGVKLETLLLHPDLPGKAGGVGYLTEFPSKSKLAEYDVIFLGDIGVGEAGLSLEQCEQLRAHIQGQAAGLVLLPGFRGLQISLTATALNDLMPVELDTDYPQGVRSPVAANFLLTQAGHESLLTRFDTDSETNAKIWKSLPGFFWHAAALKSKPQSTVLAVHETQSNRFGRQPLIVTRNYGTGKVLFMGSDAAWRWRKGVEDLYHYRFWSQMVRWMAYQRNMSSGQSMRLIYSPDRPGSGDRIHILVNAMNERGEPLENGTLTTQILSPSGESQVVSLAGEPDQTWGLFRGSFIAKEGGTYQLLTTCRETSKTLQTEISVARRSREIVGGRARLDVLKEISSITGGTYLNCEDGNVERAFDAIHQLSPPAAVMKRVALWSHPAWGLSLIGLAATFWTLRKLQGMI